MFCTHCGSSDIFELTIERHESWYFCYNCRIAFGDYFPEISLEEFCQELTDQGFPKDAEAIRQGKRASEYGE